MNRKKSQLVKNNEFLNKKVKQLRHQLHLANTYNAKIEEQKKDINQLDRLCDHYEKTIRNLGEQLQNSQLEILKFANRTRWQRIKEFLRVG